MKFLKVLFLIAGLSLFTIACGSSGGGGDSSSGISYTGLTAQAVIDKSNAQDLATSAYTGGSTGSVLASTGAIQTEDGSQITQPRTLIIYRALENAVSQIDVASGETVSGSIKKENGQEDGRCGGNLKYTISLNDETGDFNGTMNFNSYCSDGVTMSGTSRFSGKMDLEKDEMIQLTISFDNLNVMCPCKGESVTIKGDISINFNASVVTMNMLLKDNIADKVYKLENYVMTIIDKGTYIDIKVTGKYYDPDYGYVVISTPDPLRISSGDEWPSSGELVCTGASGTKARLRVIPNIQYEIDVDNDGNGTYDETLGPFKWSDL